MELEEAIERLTLKATTSSADAPYYPNCIVMKKDLITILNHLTKQDKMIDELKNGVHYQECINCGKEIRVKRIDAKYCNECAKLKQKEYFKNMPDEKKKERAEKSKQYMRELRAKRKAKESE